MSVTPKSQNYLAVAALVPLAFCSAMASAMAQTPMAMDEVIVTVPANTRSSALKLPVPLIDVPQSLSIIDATQMQQRGFRALGDIVRYTPGLSASQGEGHRDSIVFRGVRSTADFFIDGMRDDVQYYRPLYNLEQVEVLRGPNALLFGRGGTGGAVNRVSKKARLGDPFQDVDIRLDSFGGTHLAADVNLPVGKTTALRVNAYGETLDGDRDFYDGERSGINPTLKINLSPQTTLDLSYERMDHERFIDRGIVTSRETGAPVAALRDTVFGSATDNISTLEADVWRARVTRMYSDKTTGALTLHYGDYEKIYQNLYADGYVAAANTVTLKGYRDPTTRRNMIVSGYVSHERNLAGLSHTLLVGGDYIDTQSDNYRYNPTFSSNNAKSESFSIARPLDLTQNASGVASSVSFASDLETRTKTQITVASVFLQDQIKLTDRLQVLLGARLDRFDITVTDTQDPNAITAQSRKDEEISPRAGLIYKPQANVSVYASRSESFLPRSGEQFKKLEASEAKLDPDVFENTEIGLKWDITPQLSFASSLFDSQQTQAKDDGSGLISTIQGLRIDGYEMEIKGQVSPELMLSFGYTSLDGKTADNETPRELPETMYSIFAQYQAKARWQVGLGLTYQDRSLIKDGSTSYLPDYTRLDASLSYLLSGDTTVRVTLENLSDEDYYPHAHGTDQVSVGEPLNAQLSLTRKF
ncbi:MAG: TonB-dependent siderophore receptor [Rhodobiaceae bacterium]|nr:TonB-dependent siderophore receptor [Rhodobiaceae bacterium]